MAAPAVLGYEQSTSSGAVSSLAATIPAGTVSGNGLVLIVGNDDNTNTQQFTDTLTGWNLVVEEGNASADCHIAAYIRQADGTEGSTVTVTAASSDDMWAFVVRLDSMGDADGFATFTTAGIDKDFPALTTTVDNCIVFAIEAFDGADNATWTLDGDDVAWPSAVPADQIARSGTGGANASGYFVTMEQATAGAVPTLNSQASTFDGRTLVLVAMEEGAGGGPAPIRNVYNGPDETTAMYLGTTPITAAYLGSTQIFGK